jgi:hypothetical protein
VQNGECTSFWHDRWLQGSSPKDIAPDLYKLATRKELTVAQGCSNRRWMRGLHNITETNQINQFVKLWHMLRHIQLSDQRDLISWRFTPNAEYSAKSAYLMQFAGSFADYDWNAWWQTKAEAKGLFFCWLILQNKVWTADRIIKHGGSANPTCKLCFTHPETALHMLAQCPFSKTVWSSLAPWIGMNVQQPPGTGYRRLQTR